MGLEDVVEGTRQTVTGPAPALHLAEREGGTAAAQHTLGKFVMGDGISPFVEFSQQPASIRVLGSMGVHERPERKVETVEVGADVAGIGVAPVQFAIQEEVEVYHYAHPRIGNSRDKALRRLGVQLSAERLKLGREEEGICLIDLLRRGTNARACASKGSVSTLHVVERRRPDTGPCLEGR